MFKKLIKSFSFLFISMLMLSGCKKDPVVFNFEIKHPEIIAAPTIEFDSSDELPYENKEEVLSEVLGDEGILNSSSIQEKPAENSTKKQREGLLKNIRERGFFFDPKNSEWDKKQYTEALNNVQTNDNSGIGSLKEAIKPYQLFKKAIKEFDNIDETTREVINQIEKYNLFDAVDVKLEKGFVEGSGDPNSNRWVIDAQKNKTLSENIKVITDKGLFVITDESNNLKVVDRDTALGYLIDLSKGNKRFIEESDSITKAKISLGTNTEAAFFVSLKLDEIDVKNEELEANVFAYKLPSNQIKQPSSNENVCKDSALRSINMLNPYKEDGYELRGGVYAITNRVQEYALSLSYNERKQFYNIERVVFFYNNPNSTIINIGGTNTECKHEYPKYTYDYWSGVPLYFSRTKNEEAATIFGDTLYAWGYGIPATLQGKLSRGNKRSFVYWATYKQPDEEDININNDNSYKYCDCDLN